MSLPLSFIMVATFCQQPLVVGGYGSPSPPTALSIIPKTANQLDVRKLPDEVGYELTTRGHDPYVMLQPIEPARISDSHAVLAFEYFCPEGVDGLEVHYGPPITAKNRVDAGHVGRAESWLPFAIDLKALSKGKWNAKSNQLRLDFGQKPDVTLRIRDLRLRARTENEQRSLSEIQAERERKLAAEKQVNAFYETKFPNHIDSVKVTQTEIIIKGRSNGWAGELCETRPEVSIADFTLINTAEGPLGKPSKLKSWVIRPSGGISPPTRNWGGIRPATRNSSDDVSTKNWTVRVSRRIGNVDRSTSRWVLIGGTGVGGAIIPSDLQLLSNWKYATDLTEAAEHDLPRMTSKGVKGMGGISPAFPLQELVELGVHNITVNLALSGMLDSKPHVGWPTFEHAGATWYVNPAQMAANDTLIKFATDHDIVVSGILLVPFGESEFARTLRHPEADPAGHYAMPNLTSNAGITAYEAVLEFLASRYATPDNEHGRISNWIVHNEVGYGWEWTNMGHQPPMLYFDHYLRSMRLVHNVTRRHNPHARVFISLTHHWNTPSAEDWRSYSNLDFLKRLNESSKIEGDFAWGVAYHPYPQNLRKPDAWNDTRVTNDFNTPLITPKNIAVLDRWMQRPEMRDAKGNVRGLLLSEQGFNTPDYSQQSQRLQAAGFVYMWRQMRGLSSIEAFHNHRWVDHPHEGGLLLGLRKLPANGKPYGEKKFAWDVYKALDTPAERKATRFADEIISP